MGAAEHGMKNVFYIAGAIVHRFFLEKQGKLYLTVAARVPEMSSRRDENPRVFMDYPTVEVRGEMAVRLNERVQDSTDPLRFLIAICHAENVRVMRYDGGGMYRRENRLTFVLDDVIESAFPVNLNYGIVSGEVVREWHSEDPKKQFYLITVKAGDSFFTVTYFDKMMELSPRAGDQVRMLTQIQTDKKEIVDAKDSTRKMAYYTTIVARTVMKITGDPPHSDEAA